MSIKMRGLAAALGLALALLLSTQPAEVQASGCEDAQCLMLCAGGSCVEDCYNWSEWQCAGGGGWCVSVRCPIYPE